jgi:Protein of unknown function DUF262
LADLKKLSSSEVDFALLSRLVVLDRQMRSTGGLHKGNLLLANDPYALAAGFPDHEKAEVRRYLLGLPWTRLVNAGLLVDPEGKGFFSVSPEGVEAIASKEKFLRQEAAISFVPPAKADEKNDSAHDIEDGRVPDVEDDIESEETITRPFDPTKIRVETRQLSIDTLISRMENKEITLQPEFQRNEVWRDGARSRLIESILIRIPLPAFYMDATDEEKWLVVDGQQRLSTLRRFIIEKSLRLRGLEFLQDLDGLGFDELPRTYQRRIKETNVTVYLIERGTPTQVKINIFKRINTGGLPLSAQEIRHALNGGPVTVMLKELAESPEFLNATSWGVSPDRMSDREYVARFLAFLIEPPSGYNAQEFDSFLSDIMSRINEFSDEQRDLLRNRFYRAMRLAESVLEKHAFRKRYSEDENERRKPVSKALFEAWSVNLDALSDAEADRLVQQKNQIWPKFVELMNNRSFDQAVSQGTGDPQRVRLRFAAIRELLQDVLS